MELSWGGPKANTRLADASEKKPTCALNAFAASGELVKISGSGKLGGRFFTGALRVSYLFSLGRLSFS